MGLAALPGRASGRRRGLLPIVPAVTCPDAGGSGGWRCQAVPDPARRDASSSGERSTQKWFPSGSAITVQPEPGP
ncbi:hypothetical protein GCM10009590_31180 [Brachybacterium alimentarium]